MGSEQRRLLLALVLSGIVLFTWQSYFAPKQNQDLQNALKNKESQLNKAQETKNAKVSHSDNDAQTINHSDNTQLPEEQSMTLKNGDYSATVTNTLKLLDFIGPLNNDKLAQTIGKKGSFQLFYGDSVFNFVLSQNKVNSLSGVDSSKRATLNIVLENDGKLGWSIKTQSPFSLNELYTSEKKEDESRQIRQYVFYGSDVERFSIDEEEIVDNSVFWTGIDYHYHLLANVHQSKVPAKIVLNNSSFKVQSLDKKTEYSGFIVYTKKEFSRLKSLGSKLDLSIDYGIFGIIAVPILKGLKLFYSFIPNYGVAIILITLLIRMLLFPLQFKSFKSMKKMQKLQPQLQKIKEKYEGDPQKIQKETMELFKKSGANPMSGCLPMILQMPVFFAMYQVFLHSVELLNAPFLLWIMDLSVKDPYYVLPVLMGASFFLQTKLNPSTTADPTQQKMMMIMPLIFPFFMKDLPAGLNLYMVVSTSFGIIQQMIVYKVIDD